MNKVDELEQKYGIEELYNKSRKRMSKKQHTKKSLTVKKKPTKKKGSDWYKKNFDKKKLSVKKTGPRKRTTKGKRCPITENTTLRSLIAKLPLANKPLLQLLNKKDLRNLVNY